jgi:hypothetical protein
MSDSGSLEEYRTNIELWKHDDVLRQGRNQTFLAANSAALVASGLIISASSDLIVQGLTAVSGAAFGCALCDAWMTAQARHNAYIRFHRLKLVALEEEIGFSIFLHQERAFHELKSVSFGPGVEEFSLRGREKRSSSNAEARLPLMVLVLWIVGGIAGLVAFAFGI